MPVIYLPTKEADMSAEAMALAADLARKIARSNLSHHDKFDALTAIISALGAPPPRVK